MQGRVDQVEVQIDTRASVIDGRLLTSGPTLGAYSVHDIGWYLAGVAGQHDSRTRRSEYDWNVARQRRFAGWPWQTDMRTRKWIWSCPSNCANIILILVNNVKVRSYDCARLTDLRLVRLNPCCLWLHTYTELSREREVGCSRKSQAHLHLNLTVAMRFIEFLQISGCR